jgi:hypothetical protein
MPQAPARRAASESSDVAKLVRLHHRRRGRPGEREGQRLALPAARSRVALSAVPPWQLGGRHLHARRDDCHHRVDPAPEVNSWAYVVGAEHHDTFNPVSYRQACCGLPSRTGGGCRIVTEGYLSNSGGDVTWAARCHSTTRSASGTRCGPGAPGGMSTPTPATARRSRRSSRACSSTA